MINEISQIPEKAKLCLVKNKNIVLPKGIPYIGMGSSFFAALVLKYCGTNIYPEIGAEYYHYLSEKENVKKAVLLSQSGRSSEIIWCADIINDCTIITNVLNSPLGKHKNSKQKIDIYAGEEKFSSSKTYINTLLTLYLGHGFNCEDIVNSYFIRIKEFEEKGMEMADMIYNNLKNAGKGIYIFGSGPNVGTAYHAALILSESTKLSFIGMSMAQYDHGYKETAPGSVVISINPKGNNYSRSKNLINLLHNAGAITYEITEEGFNEKLSPLLTVIPFQFLAYYLAQKLNVSMPFMIGNKITEVKKE